MWKHSSAGRALPLQGRCHRFEPCCFHHAKQSYAIRRIVFLCALNSLRLREMGYAHKKETCVARVRLCRVVRMPLGRGRADFGERNEPKSCTVGHSGNNRSLTCEGLALQSPSHCTPPLWGVWKASPVVSTSEKKSTFSCRLFSMFTLFFPVFWCFWQ